MNSSCTNTQAPISQAEYQHPMTHLSSSANTQKRISQAVPTPNDASLKQLVVVLVEILLDAQRHVVQFSGKWFLVLRFDRMDRHVCVN